MPNIELIPTLEGQQLVICSSASPGALPASTNGAQTAYWVWQACMSAAMLQGGLCFCACFAALMLGALQQADTLLELAH